MSLVADGPVRTAWRVEGGILTVETDLPVGTTGMFTPPATLGSTVTLDGEAADRVVVLGLGRHTLLMTEPAPADPARARMVARTAPAGA